MSVITIDGFDKYGPNGLRQIGTEIEAVEAMIQSEWVYSDVATLSIVDPLSSSGKALRLTSATVVQGIYKTLDTGYSRLIGGIRVKPALTGATGICLLDSGYPQVAIRFDHILGKISLIRGDVGDAMVTPFGPVDITSPLVIATSTATVRANSVHYLEWDIVIGTSAAYFVYLDGILILGGTGDTRGGTANDYSNQIAIQVSAGSMTVDDFYLFDDTGLTNNAVLLSNPRIETQYPVSDNVSNFIAGPTVLGVYHSSYGETRLQNPSLVLRKYTPAVNMTLDSVAFLPARFTSSKTIGVVYSDNTGSPDALLESGDENSGTTMDEPLISTLGSPLALTAGTPYWLGFLIEEGGFYIREESDAVSGYSATTTYSSGVPDPAPSMTTNSAWVIWGNASSVTNHAQMVNKTPPPGDLSYVSSSTPGDIDLYNFPALTTSPTAIYTVAVRSFVKLTDTGNRTVDLLMKSNTTTSSGSFTDQIPGTSYQWLTSHFDNDPDTTVSWTESGLNAAKSGIKLVT